MSRLIDILTDLLLNKTNLLLIREFTEFFSCLFTEKKSLPCVIIGKDLAVGNAKQ